MFWEFTESLIGLEAEKLYIQRNGGNYYFFEQFQ